MTNFRTMLLMASVSTAALALPAMAIEAASAAPQAGDLVLEEIIVTAQRREESIQDVPVAVTVITADALASRQIDSAAEIYLAAPSVQFGGEGDFSIRGVGTLSFAPSLESSVAIAVDDVNLGRPGLGVGTFDDVARIEALSGPQGLLFGKNASSGLINIVTQRPELGTFGGSLDLETTVRDTTPGNGTGVVARGTLNIPVGENSALRVNTRYSYQNPIAKNIGPGPVDENTRDKGVRFKFLSQPADSLEIYLIGEYGERTGRPGQAFREVRSNSELYGAIIADGITPGPDNLYYSSDGRTFSDGEQGGLQGTIAYWFENDWQLSNIAAWKYSKLNSNLDTDYVSRDFLNTNHASGVYSQFSNELRLSIPASSRINGQVGLYYFQIKDQAAQQLGGMLGLPPFVLAGFPFCVNPPATVPGPPPNCPVDNDFALGRDSSVDLNSKSYAAFGQLNFEVTDQLTLLGGARVTRDEVRQTVAQMQLGSYGIALGAPGTFRGEVGNTNFTWKLGGQYDVTSEVMLYGFYARGYKGPALADVASAPGGSLRVVEPETNNNVEAGMKATFLDRKLMLNLAAFQSNYSNYQSQTFNLELQTFVLQNAGSLRSRGLEAQLIARPVRGLTLNAGATVVDAIFRDFPGAECYPGQPDCPTGSFNAAGQRLPASAKFTSTVQGMYEFPVSNGYDMFLEANWYHRSSINFTVNGAPSALIGPADFFGASVGFNTDNIRVSLFCKNCFDERVPTGLILWAGDAANTGLQTTSQAFGESSVRNIGLSISYRF
ncbi:MAG: TonB-dependent receptor [Niveispirillum sp.]|uniref:TonB-dependent receptor n=1 Tax=Niveispirillum sp. TaxID=1917217 RepID=UPI00403554DA